MLPSFWKTQLLPGAEPGSSQCELVRHFLVLLLGASVTPRLQDGGSPPEVKTPKGASHK